MKARFVDTVKERIDRLLNSKPSKPVKKYGCICDMNTNGLGVGGWCHKHKTDWA